MRRGSIPPGAHGRQDGSSQHQREVFAFARHRAGRFAETIAAYTPTTLPAPQQSLAAYRSTTSVSTSVGPKFAGSCSPAARRRACATFRASLLDRNTPRSRSTRYTRLAGTPSASANQPRRFAGRIALNGLLRQFRRQDLGDTGLHLHLRPSPLRKRLASPIDRNTPRLTQQPVHARRPAARATRQSPRRTRPAHTARAPRPAVRPATRHAAIASDFRRAAFASDATSLRVRLTPRSSTSLLTPLTGSPSSTAMRLALQPAR